MLALALLILRVVIGLTVAAHGAQKLFGWWDGPGMKGWTGAMNHMRIRPATPWAWMSAFAEFVGGIGLAVGFVTPLPSLAIAGSILVAIALVPLPHAFVTSIGGFQFTRCILASIAGIA